MRRAKAGHAGLARHTLRSLRGLALLLSLSRGPPARHGADCACCVVCDAARPAADVSGHDVPPALRLAVTALHSTMSHS